MTTYDDMRGYIHAHDRNGWFDVVTETTPMYQMVDKAETENAQLRQQLADVTESVGRLEERCAELRKLSADQYQCSLIDGCYECEWGFDGECVKHLERRMKELGVKQ